MEGSKLKAARIATAAACAAILVYCVIQISLSKLDPWRTLGLIACLAFFEAWHIRYPWGRPVRLGIAAGLCVAAVRPVPEALVIFFVGSVIGRLVSRSGRISSGDFYYIFQRTIILALAGLVFALVSQFRIADTELGAEFWTQYPGPEHYGVVPNTYCNPVVMYRALMFPLAFLCMAAVYYVGEMITSSVETGLVKSGSWRVILPHQVRQTCLVYLALAASGGLMAFYFPRLPFWNFLIFFLPLMLVRAECNRDKALDQRFFDTMRVVGDAVDQDRGVPGHSSRVSNLAVEVARCMGLPEDAVRDLRYAAVLHDVGFITAGRGADPEGHAKEGAEVLSSIPRFRGVAEMVRFSHHEPLSEEEGGVRKVPAGSKIINVVSAYDHLVSQGEKRLSQAEALQELSPERGRRYDSVVLRTLGQVLDKRQGDECREPRRERRERAKVLEDLETSFEELFREEGPED